MKKFFILLAAGFFLVAFAPKESSTTEAPGTQTGTKVKAPSLIAEHVSIGKLYYNLYDDKTAEVVGDENYHNSLSGKLAIPSTIKYESKEY